MTLSPLRRFVLVAMLWLPLSFFFWFQLANPVLWVPAKIAGPVLTRLMPDVLTSLEQEGAKFLVETKINSEPDSHGRVGVLVLEASPLIYAWGVPLFLGLCIATPLGARRRIGQLAIGLPVLWLVISWGAVFDVLYMLQFQAGPLGQAALARHGWSPDAVGLGYQFGYLILPTVTPVALWIALNQRFLEVLVGWRRDPADEAPGDAEPAATLDGPSAQAAAPVAAPSQDSGDRPA